MTGERVDFWAAIDAFYDLDADTRKALFDEFYYEDRSIGRDAMLGTIHTLRAQVAALAGEKEDAARWRYVRDNGYVVTRTVTIADKTQCFAGRVGDGFADACVDAMMAEDAARGGEG